MPPWPDVEFRLIFQWWRCHAGAVFKPFHYKVLLAVSNIPAHVWSIDVVQHILGSSCFIFDSSLRSQSRVDLSSFLVVAWCSNLDFIPTEVGFSIPEPVELFWEGESLLFLCASEIIHSSSELLHYQEVISILEVHDFSTPPSSDSDGSSGSSSSGEEYPSYNPGRGFLNSWLATRHLVSGADPSRVSWPSLPAASLVSWSMGSGDTCTVVAPSPAWSRCQVGPAEQSSGRVSGNGSLPAFREQAAMPHAGPCGG
jgi:hypothetical protein